MNTPPPRPTNAPIRIDREERWAMMSSPVRFDLVCHLERRGATSVAELAAATGRAPDSLYHHVRKLERSGIVEPAGRRKGDRNDESLYQLSGSGIEFDFDASTGHNKEAFLRMSSALFRSASRALAESVGAANVDVSNARRKNFHVRHETARLTSSDVEKINEHLSAIARVIDAAESNEDGVLHTVTWSVCPRAGSARRKKSR